MEARAEIEIGVLKKGFVFDVNIETRGWAYEEPGPANAAFRPPALIRTSRLDPRERVEP